MLVCCVDTEISHRLKISFKIQRKVCYVRLLSYLPGVKQLRYNDTFQVLIVRLLLLSVIQLVHQLVDLLTHLTIPY